MREPQARAPRYAVAMPELLHQFLSPAEVIELQAMAAAATDGWAPGRQATGYDILPLRARLPGSLVLARALAKIGTPFEDYWDAYFIRYLEGARIPPHVDPALHGKHHRRLNAVLTQAASGGELFVAGVRVDLAVGDAVLFSPDRETHEVTAVGGSRLLLSVGAWV